MAREKHARAGSASTSEGSRGSDGTSADGSGTGKSGVTRPRTLTGGQPAAANEETAKQPSGAPAAPLEKDAGAAMDHTQTGDVPGDAEAGKLVCKKCQACHSVVPGKNMLGPSLAGIMNRKAGSDPLGGPNFTSSFHVIGEIFDKVYMLDGVHSPPLDGIQTVTVPAAITEFKLDVPGNYTLVDHALARLERGLVGILSVEGPPNKEIFDGELMPGMGHWGNWCDQNARFRRRPGDYLQKPSAGPVLALRGCLGS